MNENETTHVNVVDIEPETPGRVRTFVSDHKKGLLITAGIVTATVLIAKFGSSDVDEMLTDASELSAA